MNVVTSRWAAKSADLDRLAILARQHYGMPKLETKPVSASSSSNPVAPSTPAGAK